LGERSSRQRHLLIQDRVASRGSAKDEGPLTALIILFQRPVKSDTRRQLGSATPPCMCGADSTCRIFRVDTTCGGRLGGSRQPNDTKVEAQSYSLFLQLCILLTLSPLSYTLWPSTPIVHSSSGWRVPRSDSRSPGTFFIDYRCSSVRPRDPSPASPRWK
jgi:hypothetical protein